MTKKTPSKTRSFSGRIRRQPSADDGRSRASDVKTKAKTTVEFAQGNKDGRKRRVAATPEAPSSRERVARHREELRRRGMRSITLWVPDTRSPEFAAEAKRQCLLANEADKTDPAVKFFDAIVEEAWTDLDEEWT